MPSSSHPRGSPRAGRPHPARRSRGTPPRSRHRRARRGTRTRLGSLRRPASRREHPACCRRAHRTPRRADEAHRQGTHLRSPDPWHESSRRAPASPRKPHISRSGRITPPWRGSASLVGSSITSARRTAARTSTGARAFHRDGRRIHRGPPRRPPAVRRAGPLTRPLIGRSARWSIEATTSLRRWPGGSSTRTSTWCSGRLTRLGARGSRRCSTEWSGTATSTGCPRLTSSTRATSPSARSSASSCSTRGPRWAPETRRPCTWPAPPLEIPPGDLEHTLAAFPGFADRGGRELTAADLQEPAPYRLYRATVTDHFMLCPRSRR